MTAANATAVLTGGAQQLADIAPSALGIALLVIGAVAVLALLPSYIAYRRLGRRPDSDEQVQQLDFPDWVSDGRQALIRRAGEEDRLEAEADAQFGSDADFDRAVDEWVAKYKQRGNDA